MSGQLSISTQSHLNKKCLAACEVGHVAQTVTYTDAWKNNKHKHKWALDTTGIYMKRGKSPRQANFSLAESMGKKGVF